MNKQLFYWFFSVVFCAGSISLNAQKRNDKFPAVQVVVSANAPSRILFGVEKLQAALKAAGYETILNSTGKTTNQKNTILVGLQSDAHLKQFQHSGNKPGKEGFSLITKTENFGAIAGADESGALYGCLELADRIKQGNVFPATLSITDQPEMVLRGACIGVQKPYYLPGRTVYEYPYTPETFPWLYDQKLWIQYLDSMVQNRMNSLYLWNGHPFASLVRLKDYPYAVEVDDATFKKNEEMYSFLTKEAEKRGIWVIQMFYNIIISKPFAEKHGLKTQDRERGITPLIADYTKKSIAAFVVKYPNVGLLVTLGEAMEGVGPDDVEWFTKTIIPGVRDGLRTLGRTDEPPIVLRAHDTDAPAVMKEAMPLYKNLYTMAKYNGEALTTYTPRGTWAELHRKLSRIGTVHVQNVHLLSNLEPFRYASADFIQKSVKAMHEIYEANALHLYPQASYWDWPYTADSVPGRLLEIERNWLWYKQWAHYAWKHVRNPTEDAEYWASLIASYYGATPESGKEILTAYNETGEIAPKLLRRFGITDGNRQTLTLGMQMTQLINPYRYGLFTMLYESEAPEGEMLIEYAEKEAKKIPHIGETPMVVIEEVKKHADKAVAAIERAERYITTNKEEFARLKNDILIYKALAYTYAHKAAAALEVLRYKYSNNISDLRAAVPILQSSVEAYRELTNLTKGTYMYANSMQTSQRKIPFRGADATYKNWHEILPHFERELIVFQYKIDSLSKVTTKEVAVAKPKLGNANIKWLSNAPTTFVLNKGAIPFTDHASVIEVVSPELAGLTALRMSYNKQQTEQTTLHFQNDKPVKLLVGYFNKKKAAFEKDSEFSKAPELETNATANDYGQADIRIANAMVLAGLPPVNIHTYSFKAGNNTLTLPKGVLLILGFIDDSAPIQTYDAGLNDPSAKNIDWLFE